MQWQNVCGSNPSAVYTPRTVFGSCPSDSSDQYLWGKAKGKNPVKCPTPMMISNIFLNLQWFERLLRLPCGHRNTKIVSCAISVHVFWWKMLQSLTYFPLAVINVASEHLSVDSGKLFSTVFILINSDPEKTFCGAISIQFNVYILNFISFLWKALLSSPLLWTWK